MSIQSTSLSSQHYAYFQANYKVKDASVSTLEDADYIFMGERHTIQQHKEKELWLLSKLAEEGDRVYLETGKSVSLLGGSASICPNSFLYVPVTYKGWDSLKDRNEDSILVEKLECEVSFFSSLIGKEITHQDVHELQVKYEQLTDITDNLLKKLEEESFLIPKEIKAILKDSDKTTRKFNALLKLASQASTEKLKLAFLELIEIYANSSGIFFFLFKGFNFFKRNQSLADRVIRPIKKDGRNWCIAGKDHLWLPKKGILSLGQTEAITYLKEKLKGKKYVVLAPTKKPRIIDISPKQQNVSYLSGSDIWVSTAVLVSASVGYYFGVHPLFLGSVGGSVIVLKAILNKLDKEINKFEQSIKEYQKEKDKYSQKIKNTENNIKAIENFKRIIQTEKERVITEEERTSREIGWEKIDALVNSFKVFCKNIKDKVNEFPDAIKGELYHELEELMKN